MLGIGTLLLALIGRAAEVGLDEARRFAQNWRGRSVHTAHTVGGEDGSASHHIVHFAGGGFAVLSADDTSAPIVAFSDSGDEFVQDERNPLWSILQRDHAGRKAARSRRKRHPGWSEGGRHGGKQARAVSSAPVQPDGTNTITGVEIRVAPLLHSSWDQGRVSATDTDYYCYDYYTPNHYSCGCVATSGAQIMRFFEWPKTSVSSIKNTRCSVDGVTKTLTTQGGVYDWADMPYAPNDETTESECQAIGKLTSDLSIACGTSYRADVSSASSYLLAPVFKQFGYSSALCYQRKTDVDADLVRNAILSNLDAKLPVEVSIRGAMGGHSVVVDGYGYIGSTLYYHLNMGWGNYGGSNAWYTLPDLDVEDFGYHFSMIDGFVYNIFTNQTANSMIYSGRVIGSHGHPVAGATVTATRTGAAPVVATSDENGIYALILPASTTGYTYSIRASYSVSSEQKASQKLSASVTTTVNSTGTYSLTTGKVCNLCDQDFHLVSETETPCPVPFDWMAAHYPQLATAEAFESQAQANGANGRPVWEDYLLGLDPDDATADLRVELTFVDGEPRVSTNVKLPASALAEGWRAVLKGSSDLQIWHDAETARDRFFKLVVEQFISVD